MAISGTCTFIDEYGKEHEDVKIIQTLDQGDGKDPILIVDCDGREFSSIRSEEERLDDAEGKKINCYKNIKLEKVEEPKVEEPNEPTSTTSESESTSTATSGDDPNEPSS